MHLLVTGHAGFIGSHVARQLLRRGDSVVGVDVADAAAVLQQARRQALAAAARDSSGTYEDLRLDLGDAAAVRALFERHRFERVIHLGARAGVRESALVPHEYARSNLDGFLNILEACRQHAVPHLTYASSSSVYGANTGLPYRESDAADHPLQFYAATKRANELMAHAYSHLYRLPTSGLRFFSIYGPWGRPDMVPWLFTERILAGQPIALFRGGDHGRDFTFIDDAVDAVLRCSDQIAAPDGVMKPGGSDAPWRIFNVGCGEMVSLQAFVQALAKALGREAVCELRAARPADAHHTLADTSALRAATGWSARTALGEGLARWVEWYRRHHGL
jgi:UDP-glucuronate 4-epimerase